MLNDSYGNMPLFGNGGHIPSSCAPEISRIILHLLSGSGVFSFLVSRFYSQNFILPIIWYSKVPVWPKWYFMSFQTSDSRGDWFAEIWWGDINRPNSLPLFVSKKELFFCPTAVFSSGTSVHFSQDYDLFLSLIKPQPNYSLKCPVS